MIGFAIADTGVQLGAGVMAMITAMGLIVVAVIGGYAGFLIVKRGMRWMRSAFGGSPPSKYNEFGDEHIPF